MSLPILHYFAVLASLPWGLFSDDAHLSKPISEFEMIAAAVRSYEIQTGSLPDPQLGLEALVERPGTLDPEKEWSKAFKAVPKDPWGHGYHYVAGPGYPEGFGIYSTGPDGITETQGNDPDDSNSWSDDNRGIQEGMGRHRLKIALMVAAASLFGLLCGVVLARLKNKRTLA